MCFIVVPAASLQSIILLFSFNFIHGVTDAVSGGIRSRMTALLK